MPSSVPSRIEQFIERYGLSGRSLVVGVSGGPDSLALLVALAELSAHHALQLVVAHVDHGLRPESQSDRQFVEDIASSMGVKTASTVVDIGALAKNSSTGLEEAGRNARHRFFLDVIRETGSAAVAVGHTLNDQTETRLMHLVRGTGLAGLVGMLPDSTIDLTDGERIRVVRPLLETTRAEIEDYLSERKLTPRRDLSNQDRRFTRNRLRHDVLPSLRTINPRIDDALARLGRIASDAGNFLEEELERRVTRLASQTPTSWTLDRDIWRSLPTALKRHALVEVGRSVGSAEPVSAAEIERALTAFDGARAGSGFDWPGQRRAEVDFNHVSVVTSNHATPVQPVQRVQQLPLTDQATLCLSGLPESISSLVCPTESDYHASEFAMMVSRRSRRCINRQGEPWHADFDRATLGARSTATIRARKSGDWLFPEGGVGRKKLQDVLVDAHIPRRDRDRVPILESENGVAWVIGLRRDQRFVANASATDVICLELSPRRKDKV